MFRYGLISLLFILLSAAIVVQMIRTTVVDATKWNERAKEELSEVTLVKPERGAILSDNGSILACNVVVYDVAMDFRHPRLKKLPITPDTLQMLADSLDKYYPRRGYMRAKTEEEKKELSWITRLQSEMDRPFEKRRRCVFFAKDVQLSDYEHIKTFPFINRFAKFTGTRNPLFASERKKRIYPFGSMAHLSIGRVNEDSLTKEIHGYSGLERDLDSLLYGQPGTSKKVLSTFGTTNQIEKAPENGQTLITTINIDMQDILEEELLKICREYNAEWGTAILMEVATGDIKAISNVEMTDVGFGEALNRAVLPYEPGSVMKPISLMLAFEDGLVKSVNDMVDCSPFQRTTDPHGSTVKSVRQVIEMSSNTGMARIIFRGYRDNPEGFYDRLASIGFFEPINSGIAEEKMPRLRRLSEFNSDSTMRYSMTHRHLDLARQAFGYVSEIPPLYTLSIYNAIAGGGEYVRPRLVKGVRNENGVDSIYPVSYIRERICSEETARKVRECLHDVVWGNHGTARAVRDERVEIAGKTGTAFPVEKGAYNRSKRRFAFCGFFPYDNPKYSCMALILTPQAGSSANRTSGQVLKNVAVKMYAQGLLGDSPGIDKEGGVHTPIACASTKANTKLVAQSLDVKQIKLVNNPALSPSGTIPSVIGYDPATAVAVLEKAGIEVSLNGQGRVIAQSLAAGTPLEQGMKITLALRSD